jgi:two-component system, response regulator YesN
MLLMYKVLIVDDEQNIRNGIKLLLDWNMLGFSSVDLAEDGDDAIDKIQNNEYHLIITDIRMPGISGLQLIQRIRELGSRIRIIIISGFNEFSYAKEAIRYGVEDYILKPVAKEELLTIVSKAKMEIDEDIKKARYTTIQNKLVRDKLLWDIANGKYLSVEEAKSFGAIELEIGLKYCCIYMVQIERIQDVFETDQEEASLILFYVRNILEESIEDHPSSYVYEEEGSYLGIVLFTDDSKEFSEIEQRLLNSQRYLLEVFNEEIYIACGQVTTSFKDIKYSKDQAIYAIEKKHLISNGQLANFDVVFADEKSNSHLEFTSNELLLAVEELDIISIKEQVKLLISEIISKKLDKNAIERIIIYRIYELKKLLTEHNIADNSISSTQNLIQSIKKKEDFIRLEQFVTKLFVDASQAISEHAKQSIPNGIDEIKKYIEDHLNENLSLKSIATKFYINSAYLGRLFKSKAHQSFNDYLNEKRISRVKKLYANSNLKVNEILDAVGYNSSDYFYRVFKKHEGVTFSEYCENTKKLDE